MNIIEDIVSNGHGWLDPSFVVIHETANPGATARNHRDYWSREDDYAVHYVADWTGDVYHCVPDDRLCWQVGNGNAKVVGIELCHATNQADFERVWSVGVEWAAWMLKRKGWGIDRLISHNDCTNWWGGSDHTDPIGYFQEYGRSWEQFKQDVTAAMDGAAPSPSPAPSGDAVRYRASIDPEGKIWLSEMRDGWDSGGSGDDYAGIMDQPIRWFACNAKRYRVHTASSGWLPWVSKYNTADLKDGCAGDGSPINGIEVDDSTVRHAAHAKGRGWYADMVGRHDTGGTNDTFAGDLANKIDAVRMRRA